MCALFGILRIVESQKSVDGIYITANALTHTNLHLFSL